MSSGRKNASISSPKRSSSRKPARSVVRPGSKLSRVILFPTERSKIGRKKIEAAVEAVIARRSS